MDRPLPSALLVALPVAWAVLGLLVTGVLRGRGARRAAADAAARPGASVPTPAEDPAAGTRPGEAMPSYGVGADPAARARRPTWPLLVCVVMGLALGALVVWQAALGAPSTVLFVGAALTAAMVVVWPVTAYRRS